MTSMASFIAAMTSSACRRAKASSSASVTCASYIARSTCRTSSQVHHIQRICGQVGSIELQVAAARRDADAGC